MAALVAHGLEVDLPAGWDGRIARRDTAPVEARAASTTAEATPAPAVAHIATFSLPREVGDFGSGAVELMRRDDLFVSLVEFDRDSVGTRLFAREGLPTKLRPSDFDPQALQRTLSGQAGTQVFFTAAGRPFCVYVVLGSFMRRTGTVPIVNGVLQGVRIT
jgi:hypothetical protein